MRKTNHQTLCNLVANMLKETEGGEILTNVEYEHGEVDVLQITSNERIYYEIKTSSTTKQIHKGESQIKRAMKYGVVDFGYIITPNYCKKIS